MARRTRHEALVNALLMRLGSWRMAHRPAALLQQPDPAGRTWYRIENKGEGSAPVEVFLYAEIGMWGVTADAFLDELSPLGARDITLRINSEGGEVFDGVAIYNALQRHGGRIVAHVDGLAASAASFIAMAADEIVMEPGSQMMIHDAMGMCFGNAGEARKLADMLDRTSDTIAMIYAERAGGEPGAWREVMRDVRWYDGAAAVQAKLADRVGEGRSRDVRVEEGVKDAVQALPVNGPVVQPVDYYGERPGERDSDGRFKDGMPDVIASYDFATSSGRLTAARTRDGVELSDGTNSVTLRPHERNELMKAMGNTYATEDTWVKRHTERDGKVWSVVIARVTPQGHSEDESGEATAAGMRLDIGEVDDPDDYDQRAGGVMFNRRQADSFGDSLSNAALAARVETGYGPLDMYPTPQDNIGFRMKGPDGSPTEVEFSKGEWKRINAAMNVVIDGFEEGDEDYDENAPDINKITVKTKTNGNVDVEWKGERSEKFGYPAESRMLITPQDDSAPWSIVIDGAHMMDALSPLGHIGDAIGINNRVAHAGLPIAWAGTAGDDTPPLDDWSAALIALTTPQPVSSRVDDHSMAFWEAKA